DITVAVPVNLLEIDRINELAGRITLHVLVDSALAVEQLISQLNNPINLWIKIDVGYHRCGLLWYNTEEVIELAQKIQSAEKMEFRGILTHAGHTYHQSSVDEVLRIHTESVIRLNDLKSDILDSGISTCSISIGDTPGCSLANNFTGVDEIRPGNFVFYDLMQLWLNACRYSDIAVAVTCPVIGKYPNRGEIVVHCGSVHLSKEQLTSSVGTIYGYLVPTTADGWGPPDSSAPVIALSQEHGTIQMTKDMMQHVAIGDLVTILPVHSCLTANLYSEYHTINGKSISKMQSMV
ncbi:MAG: alanine racemase, partial [Candidatus Marinimicrobia bacterium]|nr:alanine racemase [Candidatus Neomarinimicrobiota bacterium]